MVYKIIVLILGHMVKNIVVPETRLDCMFSLQTQSVNL